MTALPTADGAAPPPPPIAPLNWLETAVAVLETAGRPLRSREIVELAQSLGCAPPSRSRTPTQSVNRDLHKAVRRGDPRILAGPNPGQFHSSGVAGYPGSAPPRSRPAAPPPGGPRLAVAALAALIEARGGLRTCGVRHRPGDSSEQSRAIERLQRAYHRARKRGWVNIYDADELSVRALGLHPCQVWGGAWWDGIDEHHAPAATEPAPEQNRAAS